MKGLGKVLLDGLWKRHFKNILEIKEETREKRRARIAIKWPRKLLEGLSTQYSYVTFHLFGLAAFFPLKLYLSQYLISVRQPSV